MTTATPAQQKRLRELHDDPDAWITYWCSDQWGRSANGGSTDRQWHAEPGKVQKIDDGLKLAACPRRGEGGLHGTRHPHQWKGCRVWIVALLGERVGGDGKQAARRREIICEVRPEDVFSPQIAARFEMVEHLRDADLWGAYLCGADLRGADLRYAKAWGADLGYVNLRDADLRYADLRGADLRYVNLRDADLRYVNLRDADLWGADLCGADLRDADLWGADLCGADLRGADLRYAKAWGADMQDADLPDSFDPPDSAIT